MKTTNVRRTKPNETKAWFRRSSFTDRTYYTAASIPGPLCWHDVHVTVTAYAMASNQTKRFLPRDVNIYIFIHHQDGSTVDIRRLNKINNLCIARAVARYLSVCPSVCPSVTRRYSVETAKHMFKLFSPSGSHTILTRDIDIAILSVRSSVCLSVRNVPVLDGNGLTYCHSFYTIR